MMALARYLVQQGYNPENITILTTYTGQMFLLRQVWLTVLTFLLDPEFFFFLDILIRNNMCVIFFFS